MTECVTVDRRDRELSGTPGVVLNTGRATPHAMSTNEYRMQGRIAQTNTTSINHLSFSLPLPAFFTHYSYNADLSKAFHWLKSTKTFILLREREQYDRKAEGSSKRLHSILLHMSVWFSQAH